MKWYYLATVPQALLSLPILAILFRQLPPSDLGLLGIALIFVGLAETIGK